MTQIFLTLCMALSFLTCHAEITQINHMKEVYNYLNTADSNTLVIFDVDMVLVQPSNPAFQMANMKLYSPICKRIMKEIPEEKQMLFLSLMTISSTPVLIDTDTPRLLQDIAQKKIPAIAMTANLTGKVKNIANMESWRTNNLKQLGIDFTQTTPYQCPLTFDTLASYRGNYSTFSNGIFFVNGTKISKGDAFLAFLDKTHFYPNKVIFIDDREDNLKSIDNAIHSLNRPIEYHGLHFLGAQKFPSKAISEDEFTSQWQALASETLNIH